MKPIYESAKIKLAVVEVEAHPHLPETELLEFCQRNGIVFLAFAPLGQWTRPGPLEDPVISAIAARVGGEDATRIGPLMLQVQKKLHIFGRCGPLFYGLSAVDTALRDIAGKAANAPVCRLLGGGAADLPCYASLVRYSDPARVRAAVRRVLDAGFRSLKLHEIELPAIRAAREEAGADVEITVGVNCAWTLYEALRKAEQLREFRLKWLEEPVWPPENYDGLAELRRTGGIPIAAGENVSTPMDFERLMDAQAVDFVQPSVAKMGGITEMRKIFSIAAPRNVTVMPHLFYDGPGLLASMHVTAALGTADAMVEWRYFDLEAKIFGEALSPCQGRLAWESNLTLT